MPMSKKPDSEKKSIQSLWQTLMQILALSKPYRTRFYAATVVTILASAVWLTVPLGLRELLLGMGWRAGDYGSSEEGL